VASIKTAWSVEPDQRIDNGRDTHLGDQDLYSADLCKLLKNRAATGGTGLGLSIVKTV
jgi:signal transduction histidine kinase